MEPQRAPAVSPASAPAARPPLSWDDFSSPADSSPQQSAASAWDAISTPVGAASAPDGALALTPDERAHLIDVYPAGSRQGRLPSTAESAVRGIRQGATLNFGDELAGLAAASPIPGAQASEGAPQSFNPIDVLAGGARVAAEKVAPGVFGHGGGDTYDETVARERTANEQARQANPGSYLAGELGGGLASAIATPAIAPMRAGIEAGALARAVTPVVNATLTGGVYGGIAGAGAGEGDIADRIPSAIAGAGAGAAVGGALGTAGQAIAKPLGYVADHVNAWRNPQALADRVVARNVARDAADLPAIAQRMEDAQAVNPASPLTLADAAGTNTRGVAGTIARTPGPGRDAARNFLEERQVGSGTQPSQGERIIDRIGRVLGDRGSIAAADEIIAKRAAQARAAYEAAHRKPIDYRSSAGRELRGLLDRVPNEVRANTNRIHTIEDTSGHQLTWGNVPDSNGMFPLQAVPNSRGWDYVVRGLDAAIDRHRNPAGELDTMGNALNGLRREIAGALVRANPALGVARRIFAGHSQLLDALRSGQAMWRPGITAEAVAKDMKALTPGEQEMFRLGGANGLREKVANAVDGANKVRTVYGTPALREKLKVIAPDDKSRGMMHKFLMDEDAMAATRQRATGGSPTAERLAEDAGVGGDLTESVHAIKNVATGHAWGLVTQAARHLSKLNPEQRGAVLDEARKIILNPDPKALQAFAVRMSKLPIDKGSINSFRGAVLRAATQTASGNLSRK
jgi:hypothetical protein